MEHVQGLHLLTRADKLDRLRHHGTDREGGTTTGITVELRQDNAVEIQAFVELFGRVDGILTGHRIHDKQGLGGVDGSLDGGNLLHHLLIDSQTTGGIDDHDIVALGFGLLDCMDRNVHRILAVQLHIDGYPHLFADHAQLLDSGRTIDVARHQQRLLVFLCLQQVGELAGERRLTGTLQTRHQDDGRCTLEVHIRSCATHQRGQLVVYNLYHQLARLHRCEHVLTQCFSLYRVGKILGNLIVDVGIQQCLAHIFQRFGHIDLRDPAFTLQQFKRSV